MIADATGSESDEIHLYEIYVVDWEGAGWYPEYWEYAVAFATFRWDDDWCKRFAEFIHAWPAESAMVKLLYTDILFFF